MKKQNNLENKIKAIIIPSCNDFEDINRAKTAIEYSEKNNLPKKCVVAGLGPDTNMALGYDKNPGKENFDYHKKLHDYLTNNTDWMVGADCFSLNSVENILNVFPKGIEGKFAIVSYPLHLKRFKKIINDAKKSDKISQDVEIEFVPTKQESKWFFYEFIANLKYHFKGKQKYFSK